MSANPAAAKLEQYGEWLDKREASAYFATLGEIISGRYVLDLAKKGKLESREDRDPVSQQRRVVVSRASIQRMADERKHPILRVTRKPTTVVVDEEGNLRPAEPRKPRSSPRSDTETGVAIRDAIVERLFAQSAAPAPPVPRTWLTLEEAEQDQGLPAAVLKGFIVAGKLPALDVGRRAGGRWRVRRRDLEAIAGELQIP